MKRRDYHLSSEDFNDFVKDARNVEAAKNALEFLLSEFRKEFENVIVPEPQGIKNRSLLFDNEHNSQNYFGLDIIDNDIRSYFINHLNSGNFKSSELPEIVQQAIASSDDPSSDPARVIFEILLHGMPIVATPLTQKWIAEIINAAEVVLKSSKQIGQPLLSTSIELAEATINRELRKLPNAAQYEMILPEVHNRKDISFLCDLVRSAIGDERTDGGGAKISPPLFEGFTDMLRKNLLARIHELVQTNRLFFQLSPRLIIWFWWGSDDNRALHDFINQALLSDESAAEILDLVITRVFSSQGTFLRVDTRGLEALQTDIYFEEVAKRLLTSSDRYASSQASKFLQALKRNSPPS